MFVFEKGTATESNEVFSITKIIEGTAPSYILESFAENSKGALWKKTTLKEQIDKKNAKVNLN